MNFCGFCTAYTQVITLQKYKSVLFISLYCVFLSTLLRQRLIISCVAYRSVHTPERVLIFFNDPDSKNRRQDTELSVCSLPDCPCVQSTKRLTQIAIRAEFFGEDLTPLLLSNIGRRQYRLTFLKVSYSQSVQTE